MLTSRDLQTQVDAEVFVNINPVRALYIGTVVELHASIGSYRRYDKSGEKEGDISR